MKFRSTFAAWLFALAPAWAQAQQAGDFLEHVVVDGDTLIKLATRYLQDPDEWVNIHKANPGITNVRRLKPGSIVLVPAPPAGYGPVAIYVSGTARYTRWGKTRDLAKGDELREIDSVDVDPNSYVTLRWPEGVVTHLLPGSSLKLVLPPKGADPRPRAMELQKGTVESGVPPGVSGRSYQIRTRLGTAAVRGTQFGVRLLEQGTMVTEVSEGVVQLAGEGWQPVDVPQGTGAVADGSRRQPQAVPMLKAPYVEDSPTQVPEYDYPADPVEGAAAYEFEIAPAADPGAIIRRVTGASPAFVLRPIRDGAYRTTIRAVDAQGIPGLVTTRTLTIMSLPAPFLSEPENNAKVPQDLPTRMVCAEVPNVSIYEIVITRADGTGEQRRLTATGNCEVRLPQLATGEYQWRAFALRLLPNGKVLRSAPSAAAKFTVMVRPPTPTLQVGGGQGLNIMWEGVPDASYMVQLARDEEFKQLVSETKVDLPEVSLQVPTGGSYFVRIRTLSGSGMSSDFTPPRIIRGPAWLGSSDGQPVRDSSGTPLGPPP
jgi:hypothetical protein